jgi:hypothetical protein
MVFIVKAWRGACATEPAFTPSSPCVAPLNAVFTPETG